MYIWKLYIYTQVSISELSPWLNGNLYDLKYYGNTQVIMIFKERVHEDGTCVFEQWNVYSFAPLYNVSACEIFIAIFLKSWCFLVRTWFFLLKIYQLISRVLSENGI